LIHRCLAFVPDERPQSAGELADELRKQLVPYRRARRWVRENRRWVSVAVSALVALVLTGIGFVTLRPPYHLRQFQRAMVRYEQGDFAAAVERFSDALRFDPNHSEALVGRGGALLRLGDFRMALDDFAAARQLAPNARIDACLGYCLARLKQHEGAVFYYERARENGYEPASLLSNLGFSYRQLNRLDSAEEPLKRALALDGRLLAAHHNLVIVHLNQAATGYPIADAALDHAKRAAETGPPSAELYRHVAALFACAARERPELSQPAIEYLEQAVAHGLDPASLRNHPSFSAFQSHRQFQALLTRPPGHEPSAQLDYLVDPL
jgi:tetratricopeptide (TPR) repeat protein